MCAIYVGEENVQDNQTPPERDPTLLDDFDLDGKYSSLYIKQNTSNIIV